MHLSLFAKHGLSFLNFKIIQRIKHLLTLQVLYRWKRLILNNLNHNIDSEMTIKNHIIESIYRKTYF